MTELGKKFKCYKCGCKFYDLGQETAVCPRCGEDQGNEETKKLLRKKRRRPLTKTKPEARPVAEETETQPSESSSASDEYVLDMEDIVLEESSESE